VTDPTAHIVRDGYKGRIPQTPAEFASSFFASGAANENRMDMDSYREEFVGKPERAIAYRESVTAEHATTARKGSSFTISIPMQTRAVMLRRVQILRGNLTTELVVVM
jgi:ATP-binding cassette subfamily G (WHITE) protein 2 (SNQ2)